MELKFPGKLSKLFWEENWPQKDQADIREFAHSLALEFTDVNPYYIYKIVDHVIAGDRGDGGVEWIWKSQFISFMKRFGPSWKLFIKKAVSSLIDSTSGLIHCWFHGTLQGNLAERSYLSNDMKGRYLIRYPRKSPQFSGVMVLCFSRWINDNGSQKCIKKKILIQNSKQGYFLGTNPDRLYRSLPEIVSTYFELRELVPAPSKLYLHICNSKNWGPFNPKGASQIEFQRKLQAYGGKITPGGIPEYKLKSFCKIKELQMTNEKKWHKSLDEWKKQAPQCNINAQNMQLEDVSQIAIISKKNINPLIGSNISLKSAPPIHFLQRTNSEPCHQIKSQSNNFEEVAGPYQVDVLPNEKKHQDLEEQLGPGF